MQATATIEKTKTGRYYVSVRDVMHDYNLILADTVSTLDEAIRAVEATGAEVYTVQDVAWADLPAKCQNEALKYKTPIWLGHGFEWVRFGKVIHPHFWKGQIRLSKAGQPVFRFQGEDRRIRFTLHSRVRDGKTSYTTFTADYAGAI